ncbi:MAG: hypothetical protein P4L69_09510 [Desulfosporosinus sp.]|nr:hypothetical protein [Desulfosporosinus sp.]
MRKFMVLILSLMIMLGTSSNEVFAATVAGVLNNSSDTVSILTPPNGLVPAKGDGTDETEVIQAIFDYATAAKKTILIPKDYTFVIDRLYIGDKDHFSILGYGTLKHNDGATRSMIKIQNCSDFTIDTLTTDGNVVGNETDGNRINEGLDSTQIVESHDFKINNINDTNPAGDSLYLNDDNNVTIGTITANADVPSGRNALSIIKAQNVTVDNVISQNIGYPTMPGGIDLEPNHATDNIQNVIIKAATIRTSGTNGCAVGNHALATVKDININANITKSGSPNGTGFVLNHVDNFKGNIMCNQEGTVPGYGSVITSCNYVDADLEIYNSITGLDVGKNSSNINLKGKIIGTTKNGIEIYDGLDQGVIDMEIKQVGQETSPDGAGGVIRISSGVADNLTFKGDYSFDKSGGYCFNIETPLTNCQTEDLNMSGWSEENKVTGVNALNLI